MGFVESTNKWLKSKYGVRMNPYPIAILGIVLLFMGFVFMPDAVGTALSLALFLAPVWLPLLLVSGAWSLWVSLKQSEFIAGQKVVLLEIRPPRSLVKTPLAMETFFQGIYHSPGEATWYKRYIQGSVRPWWSLEMASIEGKVHFFIWTRVGFRKIIESQMYAQYPGVQIIEVPDYTRAVSATPEEWAIWGCDFKETQPDPLPIKTYVEYGLDKVQKEPEQTDPLANLVEFLGTLGKGEQLWVQLIIRVHKGEKFHKEGLADWKDKAKAEIKKMKEGFAKEAKELSGSEFAFPQPSKGQQEVIAAMERNTAKLAFDVGIRGLYLATEGHFDPITISGLTGLFRQFSSQQWNGIAPTGWMTEFDDYPWEIRVDKLKNEYRRGLVDAYRRRQFFYDPYKNDGMVMSTEELATIFHIPSRAVESPALERIQSATSEAPANLPT